MTRYLRFLLLLFFIQASCTPHCPDLAKTWFYNDRQNVEQQVENIRRYKGSMEYGLTATNFIHLRPDSSFTSYLADFDEGRWHYEDSSLILVDRKKQSLELVVKKIDEQELICLDRKRGKVYRFNGYPSVLLPSEEDPFSRFNNLWRVRARHKESEAEISQRLKNHFRFWEKYFAWGLKSGNKVLDVESVPSILDMYSNGFKLRYWNVQSADWKNIFYDTADCWKAYEKVYYKMYEKKIKWPETNNRFERFVSAFRQMQEWMEDK